MLQSLPDVEENEENFQSQAHAALMALTLPSVPKKLQPYLSITWHGRKGIPAQSGVDAIWNSSGEPMVTISMLFKSYIHEETMPYNEAMREFRIFKETIEDLIFCP